MDAGPWIAGQRRAPLDRLVLRGDVDDPVAADDLLGFGERPIGDRHLAARAGDAGALCARVQSVQSQEDAGLGQLLVIGIHSPDCLGIRHPVLVLDVGKHEEHEAHRHGPLGFRPAGAGPDSLSS